MAEVVLEGVGKRYPNGVEAVRNVHLRIADGELVVLMGPSGSGKTTLLRLIAGLEEITTGRIFIAGQSVERQPPHRRGVSLVAQRPALFPHLSVRDNLQFSRWLKRPLWRLWRQEDPDEESVEPVLHLLELEDLLARRPGELSGGQQQRAALGRALVRRTNVSLFDEPLASLDAPLRLQIRRQMHLLQKQVHATIIYVTHDQDEALTLGDRVVVLDRGQVQQADHPSVLYEYPANVRVAQLVGWPPMSLLPGEVLGDDRLVFRQGRLELPVPAACRHLWRQWRGRPVLLGLRAEHVQVGGPGDGLLSLDVIRVEYLGATTILTLQRGDWMLTARHPVVRSGPVEVELALPRAHLFDAASGHALAHGRQPAREC